MGRLRLSTLLISLNAGLLLLVVTGMVFGATRLFERLADEQGLARVRQAGASAGLELDDARARVLIMAKLLAERPALQRLPAEEDAPALRALLAQFQQLGGLDGCAVLVDGQVLALSGADLPWKAIWRTQPQDEHGFLYQRPAGGPLILGAWAAIPARPGGRVVVAQLLDERFAQRLGAVVGLPVTVLAQETALADSQSPQAAVRAGVLRSGEPVSARLDAPGFYLDAQPLHSDGRIVGLLEVVLPTSGIVDTLRRLVDPLLLFASSVVVFAALVGSLIGRRIGEPLRALTIAAERIGRGDLFTPVPRASGAEIGTLAQTLEEMRRRLLRLTANLRHQQAEAHAIVTGIIEGVFTVDRQRQIRYVNPQVSAMLGIPAEEAIGRFCGDVLNPQRAGGGRPCAEACPIIHARFRGGAGATEQLLLRDGRQRTIVITSAPSIDEQQVQVLRDETEAEAIRRLRDAVLANISHEFRTPLSAQLASIELLLDQLPELTVEQIGQLVLSLQRGTLRLTQLIDNLLESARIESGHSPIRQRPVALDEVLEAALELTRPLLDQRGQPVLIELPYPLPAIPGDAPRLTQVFVNLLANANKFAPAGSTIRIGGAVAETTVTLWVEDQGPGLPALGGALFDRFVRSPAEEPEQSGVGLGLWIVRSIVERHGGRIEARSSDSGMRMCVILPREQAHEDPGC